MGSLCRALFLVALAQTFPAHGQAAAALPAAFETEQPTRAFGYFIGDVLVQRVHAIEPIAPVPDLQIEQRVNDYLYRLPAKYTSDQGLHSVELRYQIINVPRKASRIALPTTRFQTTQGIEIVLEPWEFSVSSLLTVRVGEDPQTAGVLPDRSPLAVIDQPDESRLKHSLIALLASAGLWLGWWAMRHFKDAHTLPFAKARRAIARLPKSKRDTDPESWIAMHRAFNAVAGKTINTGSVGELFIAAPWLMPNRGAIERFYSASDERFFELPDNPLTLQVSALCDTLYRLETRHATSAARQAVPRVSAS